MIFLFFGSQLPVSGLPQITTQVTIFLVQSQLTKICSKSTIDTLKEKEQSMFKVNNKGARTTLRSSVCLDHFKHELFFSSVYFTICFENVNVW